jgi:nucleoside-diphosphate-sugar epimerase
MLNGKSGEAYNIADKKSNITLLDLAELVSKQSNTKITFDIPNEIEKNGFSKAMTAILNPQKINELGWYSQFSIQDGINRTIKLLKDCNK